MTSLDMQVFRSLVESSPEAVVLVDAQQADHPVVYANPSFLALTGYAAEDLLGRNLRLLQGVDRDQDARLRLREHLIRGETCHVIMRNFRKDGTPFWNEMTVLPLRGADGAVAHFAGFHRESSTKVRIDSRPRETDAGATAPVTVLVRDDRLTGLYALPYLEELLKRDWAIAQREHRSIAVFSVDIDALDLYNTTFGRAAGDSTIRRVGHCISGCLRRASDASARADGGSFVAFAPGLVHEQALRLGQLMAERVRDLRIHHPRCSVLRYVSVSVGVAAVVPAAGAAHVELLLAARQQLQSAKQSGRNRAA